MDIIKYCESTTGTTNGLQTLINNKYDIEARNKYTETALMRCCVLNKEEFVKVLLNNKANVNSKTSTNIHCLIHACKYEINTRTIKLLIDNNADINAQCMNGYTALDMLLSNNTATKTAIDLFLKNTDKRRVFKKKFKQSIPGRNLYVFNKSSLYNKFEQSVLNCNLYVFKHVLQYVTFNSDLIGILQQNVKQYREEKIMYVYRYVSLNCYMKHAGFGYMTYFTKYDDKHVMLLTNDNMPIIDRLANNEKKILCYLLCITNVVKNKDSINNFKYVLKYGSMIEDILYDGLL